MPEAIINTGTYKLFPSPRNAHREVFLHEVFVPHAYAMIDLPSFHLELEADAAKFNRLFVPD